MKMEVDLHSTEVENKDQIKISGVGLARLYRRLLMVCIRDLEHLAKVGGKSQDLEANNHMSQIYRSSNWLVNNDVDNPFSFPNTCVVHGLNTHLARQNLFQYINKIARYEMMNENGVHPIN